jgi:hypothetical protein
MTTTTVVKNRKPTRESVHALKKIIEHIFKGAFVTPYEQNSSVISYLLEFTSNSRQDGHDKPVRDWNTNCIKYGLDKKWLYRTIADKRGYNYLIVGMEKEKILVKQKIKEGKTYAVSCKCIIQLLSSEELRSSKPQFNT